MILKIRNSRITKGFSILMIFSFLSEIIQPTVAWGLTGGPSQPEVQGFTPIGTSENVDLGSGAFNYNIPLMDVGGYPINISYSSGVTMDQEASWVGLGWNLNPGVMNRNMRGIPDDFKGDEIKKEFNIKDNISAGVQGSFGAELVGLSTENLSTNLSFGMGINWNSYDGYGFSMTISPSFDFSKATSDGNTAELGLGVGLTASDDGLNINPSLSLGSKEKEKKSDDLEITKSVGAGVGATFNTRGGFRNVSMNISGSRVEKKTVKLPFMGLFIPYTFSTAKSGGVGSSISLVDNTYVPSIQFPKVNGGISFSAKFGGTFFGLDGTYNLGGYYNHQSLLRKEESVPSYGYMYSQDGQHQQKVIHDFNREKDAFYTKRTPNLPVTNYTYDLFTAVGQGVGGMFRPFRGDIGHVYDNKVSNGGIDGSLGLELGSGGIAKGGIDIDVNYSGSSVKKWDGSTNKAKSIFSFSQFEEGSDKEPTYFKQVGEMAVDEDPLFENMKSFDPVAIKMNYGTGIQVNTTKNLFSDTELNIPVNFPTKRSVRAKRNTLLSYKTVSESGQYALPTQSTDAPHNGDPHKMHEMTITRNDGVRYVYGIPAYNLSQKEVTFNTGALNQSGGQVTYNSGDNTVNNQNGVDHYFESTELPEFAHSYLLTAVISPDYVDRSGDGPTKDDYGTYTKFSYKRVHDDYNWRVPYEANSAKFNEGLRTLDGDNKGSYVHGVKELWYLDKIETKTHVAVFSTSPRNDGYDVAGENGGTGSNAMYKLDKITLYAKPDYDAQGTAAEAIKSVHFVYDYYLCPGVPNNGVPGSPEGSGKLTLREIYYTYGDSERGKLSAYKFKYGDFNGDGDESNDNGNAPYDLMDYNMWGTYKPDNPSLPNSEHPYVVQDKPTEDEYSAQWHLTNIILPSGGEMTVNYESNDYNYVQDHEALQFFNVVGCAADLATVQGAGSVSALEDELWAGNNTPGAADNVWTVVEIPQKQSGNWTDQEFRDQFLAPLNGEQIRFNYLMNFSVDGANPALSEYVSGYATIDESSNFQNAGIITYGTTDYGYFKFDLVPEENKDNNPDSHPVARTAWQWVRINNPHLAYDQNGGNYNGNPDATTLLQAMGASMASFVEVFAGPNGFIRKKGMGKKFDINKSWVRLAYPGEGKLGGGCRVKKIALSDQWDKMAGGNAVGDEFGQTYEYVLENGNSSGVATFEPLVSKENALITPMSYEVKRFGVPNEKYMLEKPYGLSYFPSPKVTYSRVEVASLNKVYNRNGNDYYSKNRTGKTVTEYYTTKDFPTIVRQTPIQKLPFSPDLAVQLLKLNVREHANVSQGYVVELNDMDGKIKSQMVFAENKTSPVSGVMYRYGTTTASQSYSGVNPSTSDPFEDVVVEETKLNNTFLTIAPNGDVENNTIGVEFDIITDFREHKSEAISGGVDGNLAGFLAAILPIAVPTILPTFSRQNTRFRSAVTTKVVNRYGVLTETIAFDNGASVSTQNLAWDKETGSVLLTKTKNEFGDEYYSMNYPAHWTYERMGQAYKNIGFITGAIGPGSGTGYYAGTGVENLVKGDEVILTTVGTSVTSQKAWVLELNASNEPFFIDQLGNAVTLPTGITSAKVIRSGRRNQHDLSVGNLTLKSDPTRDAANALKDLDNLSFEDTETEVIAASAIEFSEDWGLQCGGTSVEPGTCVCTPSQAGIDFFTMINAWVYNLPTNSCGYLSDANFNTQLPVVDLANFNSNTQCVDLFTSTVFNALPSTYTSGPNINLYIDEVTISGTTTLTFKIGPSYINSCEIQIIGTETALSSFPARLQFGSFESLDCNPSNFNLLVYKYSSVAIVSTHTVSVSSSCFDFFNCAGSPDIVSSCGLNPGDIVNPFRENIQGNWRPLRSHTRLGERKQMDFDAGTNLAQVTNIRTQGKYENFKYFWQHNANPVPNELHWGADPTGWTWVTTITPFRGYDQDGMEIENYDALYRFSSAIHGYANTYPIAVAANATHRQIAFDGFEDYAFYPPQQCNNRHFIFDNANLTDLESHTGRYSLKILGGGNAGVTRSLLTKPPTLVSKTAPYEVREVECIGTFGPETYDVAQFAKNGTQVAQDKKYVISYWIKQADQSNLTHSYDNSSLNILTTAGPVTLSSQRKSKIIDGWQKVEYLFTLLGDVSGNPSDLSISFVNNGSTDLYLDDVRIQPYNSAMKTYVYDPITLRLWAELDDNNFATLYEYDEEGALIRIKKETQRGIVTIQESRNGIIKQPLP